MLWTGSRAAPIPKNATASFTSASAFFKKTTTENGLDTIRSFKLDMGDYGALDSEDTSKRAKAKARKSAMNKTDNGEGKPEKAPRKTTTKKGDDGIDGTEVKKQRKPRAKKVEESVREDGTVKETAPRKPRTKKGEAGLDVATKEKPVRKPRAKKSDNEGQAKLSRGKVTKPSTSKSENVDTSKSKKSNPIVAESPDPFADSLDFGLVEAVPRRPNWTPPEATAQPTSITLAPVVIDKRRASSGTIGSGERSKGFNNLFGNFGYTNIEAHPTEKKAQDGAGIKKRKLIELVKTNVSDSAAVTPKEKAPKKKARTITDQATSAYAEDEELPVKPAPLLQYFSYQTSDGFKIPPKPRAKCLVKTGSKSKKGSAQAPILFSPESAMKQVGNQDFVFGTSSQLAREESPTLLRDLHQAMQASNEIDPFDPFADSGDEQSFPALGRGKVLPTTKRNLWSAAARDATGELLEVEMVDLADSPAVARQMETSFMQVTAESRSKQDEWHDIERLAEGNQESVSQEDSPRKVGPIEAAIRNKLLSSPPSSRTLVRSSPKYSIQVKRDESPPKAVKPSTQPAAKAQSTKSKVAEKPDYSACTTAQLAKEIASYHFKHVKNRDQMITLLEKCWEGKQRKALGVLGTNSILSTSPSKKSKQALPPSSQAEITSPKRPRGRPRKDSTTVSPKTNTAAKRGRPKASETVEYLEMDSDTPLSQVRTPKKPKKKSKEPVEEISDSDSPSTPSPPRRRASQIGTPRLPLQLSSADSSSPKLSPTLQQKRLFTHITRAVTNAPPSQSSSNPNWHEKILLYDPIILEDLTVWLNTGALEKTGWDGEVEPKEVKKWCESKSICCLWKENLRGGARSHY